MKKDNLKSILELLEYVPRERILKDLRVAPGWSYHGPSQKNEVKIGIGKYDKPIIKVTKEDHNDPNNWFYYQTMPHYEIISYLPSKPSDVIEAAIKVYNKNGRMVDGLTTQNNGKKLILSLDDSGEMVEVIGNEPILAAYELYVESLYDENIMMIPSLKNLIDVEDVNESYGGEPTIEFIKFPFFLDDKEFEGFFKEMKLDNKCIGKLRLMEGEFWIISHQSRPVISRRRYTASNKKATHIGGYITRLN